MLLEKIDLTAGVGFAADRYLGNASSIPRLNFPGLCFQDTPVFFATFADFVSAFPVGIHVAASMPTYIAKQWAWNTAFMELTFSFGQLSLLWADFRREEGTGRVSAWIYVCLESWSLQQMKACRATGSWHM